VIAAYLMPFQLSAPAVVVAWAVLALGAGAIAGKDPDGETAMLAFAGGITGIGLLRTIGFIAPPGRLAVDEFSRIDHPLLLSGATAALGALAIVLGAGAWRLRERREARTLAPLAGVTTVYLLSVALVDEFQRRIGGATALEELQKQAQAGLSILWAILGAGVFIVGVVRPATSVRLFGLALLGVTTLKVFIIDLAALDAAYRVLSFIGLGVLLLFGSWAYQHWMAGSGDDNRPRGSRGHGPRPGPMPG
jgi:uncharacterized membrane protein